MGAEVEVEVDSPFVHHTGWSDPLAYNIYTNTCKSFNFYLVDRACIG